MNDINSVKLIDRLRDDGYDFKIDTQREIDGEIVSILSFCNSKIKPDIIKLLSWEDEVKNIDECLVYDGNLFKNKITIIKWLKNTLMHSYLHKYTDLIKILNEHHIYPREMPTKPALSF
jgi:hypothetical protein